MLETLLQKLLEFTFGDRLFRVALLMLYGLSTLAGLLLITAVLLRVLRDHQQRQRQKREQRWRSLLLAVLTEAQPPQALWAQVSPKEAMDFCAFLYRFARLVTGSELEQLHALAAPYLPRLERQVFRGTPEERAFRLQILGVLGRRTQTELLVQALDDPAPLVVLVAFRQLAHPETAHLAPILIDQMPRLYQTSPALLGALLAWLGFEALPALRQALLDEHRPVWVRVVLADALHRLNDPKGAHLAADLLQHPDLPAELVQALLRLIAAAGTPAHQGVILPYLQHPDEAVRVEAVRALGVVGSEAQLPRLAAALQDPSPWVAMAAARALKQRQALTLLQEAARQPALRPLIEQVLHEDPARIL